MRAVRMLLVIAILVIAGVGGFVLWSQRAEIPPLAAPKRADFAPELIDKGAQLAAIGNCVVCHTLPGGPAFAGVRPIPTPFGTLYSTNITPDPDTGIGRWSEAAFRRAMREGIARDGRHLYPAFPYDHYTHASDDDIRALYAFVITRPAVSHRAHANALPFPFDQRWVLAAWNLLYLDQTPFRPDPKQSAEWNRGRSLVGGLGHCGDCHSPRNLLGAEKSGSVLSGGEAERWSAPALNAASPAPVPWDAAHLFTYLRQGWDSEHGGAAGPMQPIVAELAKADESDVRAIAVYIAAQIGAASPERRQQADRLLAQVRAATQPEPPNPGEETGAAVFAGACAECHIGGPGMAPPHGIDLRLSTAIAEAGPRDAVFVILDGIRPSEGLPGPWMPRFDGAFTDAQLAGLLAYLRAHYGHGPAWTDLEHRVHEIRQSKERS